MYIVRLLLHFDHKCCSGALNPGLGAKTSGIVGQTTAFARGISNRSVGFGRGFKRRKGVRDHVIVVCRDQIGMPGPRERITAKTGDRCIASRFGQNDCPTPISIRALEPL